MNRVMLLGLAVVAIATLTVAEGVQDTPTGGEALRISGRIAPAQWQDALGICSEVWLVEVTVYYGDEVYDRWRGPANAQGSFEAPVYRAADRSDACVVVKVGGSFVYHDAEAQIEPELEPEADLGVIRMQRRF